MSVLNSKIKRRIRVLGVVPDLQSVYIVRYN